MRQASKRKLVHIDESEEEEEDEDLVWRRGCSVYFHAPVTKKTISNLLHHIGDAASFVLDTNTILHTGSVILYIHSNGGEAYAGLSAMDHISNSKVRIVTVADGFVASAATFLLLAGQRRYALPHSSILIHQLSTGFWGKYCDLLDEVKNSKALMHTIRSIYKEKTTMSELTLQNLMKKEISMGCEKCIKWGFVHEMLVSPLDTSA